MNKLTQILVIILLLNSNYLFSQSYSTAKVKAIWIYNIIEETTWPNENQIDTFKLGMYNPDNEFSEYLKLISAKKTVKNRPLYIFDIAEIDIINLNLVYTNNPSDSLLNSILLIANENPILSISDNSNAKNTIIQFVQKNKSLNIDINDEQLRKNGFKISPRLVAMVTQSEELKQLYIEAENKLSQEQDLVKQQKEELSAKEKELEEVSQQLNDKIKELEEKNTEISKQKELLHKQEKDIQAKHEELLKLNSNINYRQKDLNKKITELVEKENEIQNQKDVIAIQQNNINQQLETLNGQQAEIDDQKNKIKQQQDQVYDLIEKRESQKIIFRLTLILLIVASFFAIYVLRNLNVKKKINQTLEKQNFEILEKNEEIQQQKEELRAKADLLTDVNQELEKLSLVARRTDNAISIYDAQGNIEWVNESFKKYYKVDLNEFIELNGINLRDHSRSDKIEELIKEAIKTKKSVKYQNKWKNDCGSITWFQSTLTPLFEETNTIKRFIVVDSEITKIVNAQELIDQKNKDITDSIKYAERIQTAILPNAERVNGAFENSFVYFNPRDIISGDFYWFEVKHDKIFIATADCTGHGVPGALMSVIGYSLLNKIVNKDKTSDPGKILNDLRDEIIESLQQSFSKEYPLDGMDITLCVFNKSDYNLKFAGANQFMYVIRDKKIHEYKGDTMPIALYDRMEDFKTTEINLKENDMIYMFSDGYADQIGGNNGKKYKYRKFRDLLIELSTYKVSEQKRLITKEFNEWKGSYEQVDDVIVMGIRI